jgi:hypothetical protein
MGDDDLRRLAVKQRRRMLASLLSAAENSPWWPKLSNAEKSTFRDKVIDSVNGYHDVMLDVISVGAEDLRSADVMGLLEQVHASQLRLERDAPKTEGLVDAS